jgi:hypothetical protein
MKTVNVTVTIQLEDYESGDGFLADVRGALGQSQPFALRYGGRLVGFVSEDEVTHRSPLRVPVAK